MSFDTQPGLVIFTPEGQRWAREYLMRTALFTVSELHLDAEDFADLASDEITATPIGVTALVDAVYKKGTPEEHLTKIQVLIKWEYVATVFYAKGFKRNALGFRLEE